MKSLTSLSTKNNECLSNYGEAMALGHPEMSEINITGNGRLQSKIAGNEKGGAGNPASANSGIITIKVPVEDNRKPLRF